MHCPCYFLLDQPYKHDVLQAATTSLYDSPLKAKQHRLFVLSLGGMPYHGLASSCSLGEDLLMVRTSTALIHLCGRALMNGESDSHLAEDNPS
eukprot:504208-Amphidinium_carterae.1